MIEAIIIMIQNGDVVDQEIDIARGKYKLPETFDELKNLFKIWLSRKKLKL